MSDHLLARLAKRRFPWLATTAYAGGIESAAYMPHLGVTMTVDSSKPDQDIEDAINRIKELEAALGSLQEMLAKQVVGTDTGLVCAACGEWTKYGEPEHDPGCPVSRGLAIIEAALGSTTHGK